MDVEDEISAGWAEVDEADPGATIEYFRAWRDRDPGSGVLTFELASAYDWAGREQEAIPLYEQAIRSGLAADRDRQARIQLGSSLRNVGHPAEAAEVLRGAVADYPDSGAAVCFLALALAELGEGREATGRLITLVTERQVDDDVADYRRPLSAYAQELWAEGG